MMASPAKAITNGEPDNRRHPDVGLAVFDDANGPSHRCSASLLSPTVVLTAGHCTDGTVAARVWFDEDVQNNSEYPFSGGTSYDGIPYTNPDFCIGCGNGLPGFPSATSASSCSPSRSRPVWSASTPSSRRPAWSTSCPARHGHAGRLRGAGADRRRRPAVWAGLRVRLMAPVRLISGSFTHSEEFVRVTASPGQGGGTCFGDSGGPNFLGDSTVVAGITSFGVNGNCAGTGGVFRTDRKNVLDFIKSYLP